MPANDTIDYYPFGMQMPGRVMASGSYRYGFNSQEKVDEIYGVGNSYTAEYWQYDSRLGRRWNVDPMTSEAPGWSPFRAFYDNPIFWTDPTGLLEDNYSVDDKGNVTLEEETDDDFDKLYTKSDWDAGNKDNGLKVNDRSILPDLSQSRSDFNGRYASSSNKSELFNIFYFAVENTNVEWGLTGHRMGGGNEYVLRTSQDNAGYGSGGVSSILIINRYSDVFSMSFDIHSHPTGGTEGASNSALYDDMDIMIDRYYRFQEAGMKNTNTWFKKDGKWTVFPKHYVYTKGSNNLYHYTPWDNDIFIRNIEKSDDLYRGLGF